MEAGRKPVPTRHPNHSHAWRATWQRPVKIDEDQEHPFTVARMTDHNVRGHDTEGDEDANFESEELSEDETADWENEGGRAA